MAEMSSPDVKNCSYAITAHLDVPAHGAEGVVICQGGNMAGWSIYVDADGRPTFHYNLWNRVHTSIRGPEPLPTGDVTLETRFSTDGGIGAGGDVVLIVNGDEVAAGRVDATVPFVFSMSGETMDVGVDSAAPVGPYPHGYPFRGVIHRVEIELSDQLSPEQMLVFFAGQASAAAAQQ